MFSPRSECDAQFLVGSSVLVLLRASVVAVTCLEGSVSSFLFIRVGSLIQLSGYRSAAAGGWKIWQKTKIKEEINLSLTLGSIDFRNVRFRNPLHAPTHTHTLFACEAPFFIYFL